MELRENLFFLNPVPVFRHRIFFASPKVIRGLGMRKKKIARCLVFRIKAVPLQADYYQIVLRV